MKKITYLLAGFALLLGTRDANAQSGYMFNQHWFNPQDMANISFWSPQYASSRATAMGGAFSSLGADLSTMHINPAGLGMYQSSEFGITPMITFSKATNSDPEGVYNYRNRKSRFAPANAGIALNFYQGTGSLTAFTFGFGYNRIADFNSSNRMYFGDNFTSSLGDAMVQQINGIDLSQGFRYDNHYGSWGSLLAYENGFIRRIGNTDQYEIALSNGTMASQGLATYSSGSIGEYNISGGFNFGNKLYFGMSIGIQDLLYKQRIGYDEAYRNNTTANPAEEFYFDQYKKITGTGVNFKTGIIYRPTEPFRLALAVHTPTYYTITHEYTADVDVIFNGRGTRRYNDDAYDVDFSTPVRLLAGASYTFGRTGVLSVDYERTWYNSMRYRKGEDDFANDMIKGDFTGTHTVRVGGELRPFDYDFSLRAGFNYTGSMVNIDLNNRYYQTPIPMRNIGLSGGFGWRVGRRATLDVAYAYNYTKYTDTEIYYFEYSNGDEIYGGNPKTSIKKHAILATLGFRF